MKKEFNIDMARNIVILAVSIYLVVSDLVSIQFIINVYGTYLAIEMYKSQKLISYIIFLGMFISKIFTFMISKENILDNFYVCVVYDSMVVFSIILTLYLIYHLVRKIPLMKLRDKYKVITKYCVISIVMVLSIVLIGTSYSNNVQGMFAPSEIFIHSIFILGIITRGNSIYMINLVYQLSYSIVLIISLLGIKDTGMNCELIVVLYSVLLFVVAILRYKQSKSDRRMV